MNRRTSVGLMLLAPGILSAQNSAPPVATAASGGRGGGGGRNQTPPEPPVADLTGSWISVKDKDKPAPSLTLILKQTGNKITGIFKPGRSIPGLPADMQMLGAIEGSQMDLMSLFDYENGELAHFRGEYKDGHLVGQQFSIHTAPHKWRQDATTEFDYIRVSQ